MTETRDPKPETPKIPYRGYAYRQQINKMLLEPGAFGQILTALVEHAEAEHAKHHGAWSEWQATAADLREILEAGK